MKKNMLVSMVLVFCSTLFLLTFLAGGLYVFDMLARKSSVEATSISTQRISENHTTFKEISRLKEENITVFFQLKEQPIEEPITIAFAGDVMMDGSIERVMNKHGYNYPFLQVKKELEKVDYAIVNLETAVTKRGTPYSKQYNFRTGPQSLKALKDAGFQMVSLANNHTMDFGEEGLVDTIDYLNEIGLAHVGAGRNSEEAYAEEIIEIKGKKIAILGFSRVLPTGTWYATPSKPGIASGYQVDRMLKIIERVREEVDYLFVFMHWGIERQQIPEPYQFKDARAMIDAGADGIIGAHPHVIQGLDFYKGKPIAYSLGNFLFPDYVSGLTAESCVLTLIIDGNDIKMQYTPYQITGNQVAALDHETIEKRLIALKSLSYNVKRDGSLFINP
ncbi:CapA family protein [Anaerobacillus isosaccharinicus]|uniref:CapA family protein n=2 Tax=Anaerobacillus isosaccharinicus TaxID=1532552 RepID=A0A7S7L421_9BACI|nr:CapA family protein [Anaerobacillus isosaccharinicus]MBA5587828.1 CapA family protein [Anaerobacillus isosaccharinicus]QOY34018.1 CapA family protein [Anaerobacillus isosaccharinicus]